MKFGVMFANTGMGSTPDGAVELARTAEESGFESVWTVEHVLVPSGYRSAYPYDPSGKMAGGMEDFDLPDPLVWLTWVAAHTSTLRLGTGVLVLPQRNPAIVAKEVATLDRYSGGRVLLGVGVGWLREEFDALGVPFEGRGGRMDEYIEVMRALWTADRADHEGTYVTLRGAVSRPRPAQTSVPIVIGGHTTKAARRAGRLGDGFFPGKGSIEELRALFAEMRRAAEDAGRDPARIELTTGGGPPEHLKALADLGVARVVVPAMRPERLRRFGDEVIAAFG